MLQQAVSEYGYSLIELLIVLVMMAVILSIVVPATGREFRRTATRAAADEFLSAHMLARSLALRHGRVSEMHIEAAESRVRIEVDTGSTPGVATPVRVVRYIANGDLTLESDRSVLCFDLRGLPTTRGPCEPADATVIFSLPGDSDTIWISPLGEVRQ
jgi:prepilin-type N-terminal cleavage/methylation domain-containing protein